MANDLGAIEIPIIAKDNQLKAAVTTVGRLERELNRLAKAADLNNVSEERYRQTLIKVGRELKSVTQLTGTQAYGAVVKYTNAKKKQIAALNEAQVAAKRAADEDRKAAAEQKRVEQAAKENTTALNRMRAAYDSSFAVEQRTLDLKRRLRQEIANGTMTVRQAGAELLKYRAHMQQFNLAQMAATKTNNRMGVVVQQTGYQVGDFLVQIQSGTNPMVAFGQQATQLVGILPLMASSLGMTTAAAIGLSTVLGIGIPLITAVGAAFMRTRGDAEDASKSVNTFEESLKSARDEIVSMQEALEMLRGGFESKTEFTLSEQIKEARINVRNIEREINAEKERQIQISIAQQAALGNLNEAQVRAQAEAALAGSAVLNQAKERLEAAQGELDVYEALSAEINRQEREKSLDEQIKRARELSVTLYQAWENGRDFGELGLDSGVNAAAFAAAELARQLGISLDTARDIVDLGAAGRSGVSGPDAALSGVRSQYGGQATTNVAGILEKDIVSRVRLAARTQASSGSAGSSATDPLLGQVEQLEKFLSSERELLLMEYDTRQVTLEQALEKEYITRQQYASMIMELEGKKNKELTDLELKTQQSKVSAVAGGIQDVLNAAANGNERLLKAARVVGAAEALINTYRAAAQTLADPKLPFFTKFAAAASVVASGLGMVNAIKSGSQASVSGSGAAPSGADAEIPTQATAAPQRVIIEGIDRNSLISGEQLSNIFEALYKENENRGFVFEVAR